MSQEDDVMVPLDDDQETMYLWSLTPEELAARAGARMPPVDHLQPAVKRVAGLLEPLFGVGTRIVAERYSSILSTHQWLDTRVLHITEMDTARGIAWCTDEMADGATCVGWRDPWVRLFLAPKYGDPFSEAQIKANVKKRAREDAELIALAQGKAPAKKRGRPKGSKNRPAAVIREEKRAKAAKLREKRAKKRSR